MSLLFQPLVFMARPIGERGPEQTLRTDLHLLRIWPATPLLAFTFTLLIFFFLKA